MVGEMHKRGYQKIRAMPYMAASGCAWRCWIGPDTLFYRNHGAFLWEPHHDEVEQSISPFARFTTGAPHYFDWKDADQDDARTLADKFLSRFTAIARDGEGWSYAYAGWYQRMLGLAERGWIPVVIHDSPSCTTKRINLFDQRPEDWKTPGEKKEVLPLPPAGKLHRDLDLH